MHRGWCQPGYNPPVAVDPNIFQIQEQELRRLQSQMEDLRRRYDFYFLGLEKREPGFYREQMEKALRKTKLNAALQSTTRFQYKQFLARYRTYCERWDRVLREMEQGTYRRGSVTAAERLAAKQATAAMRRAEGLDEDGNPTEGDAPQEDETVEERRIRMASRRAQQLLAGMLGSEAPAPPPAAKAPPVGDVQRLYDSYVKAKQNRGEDVSNISMARFARSVKKQRDLARSKLGTDVELKVKVTDKKVTLVASRRRKKD